MYYRTVEETEAAEALCMACKWAEDLDSNLRMWRWVVIALHNAAQGLMVLSLRHGSSLAALNEKCASEWLKAHETGGPYPKDRLDSFPNLYRKVKSKKYGEFGGNKRFVPKGTQERSIKKLNEIRNEFIHFTPKGWSLEVNGLPTICIDAIALIEFLGWETDNIFWHDASAEEQAHLCALKVKRQMERLKELYSKISS